jgi:hypothetical protein
MSDDGRLVIFEEGNDTEPDGYGIYLRRTDGSPPQQLGYGHSVALSPDGAWLAVIKRKHEDDAGLSLLPTGPGEPRPVDLGGLKVTGNDSAWLAGTAGGEPESLVLAARLGDGSTQLFRLPLSGTAAPVAITPAGFALAAQGHIASAASGRVIVKPAEGVAVEFGLDGQGPRAVPGLLPGDLPLRFDRDGRHVYVQAAMTVPSPIYRVDTLSGERSLWCELAPADPAGVFIVDRVLLSGDGAGYAYSIRRYITQLVAVSGLH